MKQQDLLTKEEFVPSRITQKFAKPENRIKYYNDRANQLRHSVAYVNKPLHRNLLILNELLAEKQERKFHKEYLRGKGYDFMMQTHFTKYEGIDRCSVYKYILIPIDNDYLKIVKEMIDITTLQVSPIPPNILELQKANSTLKNDNKLLRNVLIALVIVAGACLIIKVHKNRKENDRKPQPTARK